MNLLPPALTVAIDSRPRETRDTLFLLAVLAWTLLAMIVGHASMAIWHRVALRDKVWGRMV